MEVIFNKTQIVQDRSKGFFKTQNIFNVQNSSKTQNSSKAQNTSYTQNILQIAQHCAIQACNKREGQYKY